MCHEKKIQKMYEFFESTLVCEYITKFDKLSDYRFFSSLNIANFPKKYPNLSKILKSAEKGGKNANFEEHIWVSICDNIFNHISEN